MELQSRILRLFIFLVSLTGDMSAIEEFYNKLSCQVLSVNISIRPIVFSTPEEIRSYSIMKNIRQEIESTKEKELKDKILNMVTNNLHNFEEEIEKDMTEKLPGGGQESVEWEQWYNKSDSDQVERFFPLDYLNVFAEHSAKIQCTGVGSSSERFQQLYNLFGPGYRASEIVHGSTADESRPIKLRMPPQDTQYIIKWNTTNFKSSVLNINTLLDHTHHLPFYMHLIGGERVKNINVDVVYISDYLLFKTGNSRYNIEMSYNDTRWQYMLHDPYLKQYLGYNVGYRLTVSDEASKRRCESSNPVRRGNTLQITCRNHKEDKIRIGLSTKVCLYTVGDKSHVPKDLFNSLLAYSKLCKPYAYLNGKVACHVIKNADILLLLYFGIVMFIQLQCLMYMHSDKVRTQASGLSLFAYMFLYCPCIIITTDFKQLSALLYIFYLEGFKQGTFTHSLLALSWVLYPGFMFVTGLLPAILFVSDLKNYGHFHSCFIPRNCKKTDSGQYECRNKDDHVYSLKRITTFSPEISADENPSNKELLIVANVGKSTMACGDMGSNKSSDGLSRDPQCEVVLSTDDIALGAVWDIFTLFHWALILYCLPWLAYYVVMGLYPLLTGINVFLGFTSLEFVYCVYCLLRSKA